MWNLKERMRGEIQHEIFPPIMMDKLLMELSRDALHVLDKLGQDGRSQIIRPQYQMHVLLKCAQNTVDESVPEWSNHGPFHQGRQRKTEGLRLPRVFFD